MIKNSLIIFSLIIIFFSCKKETLTLPVPNHNSNNSVAINDTMLPIAIGNYWIYQLSDDDTLGGVHLQNNFDSVYVEKDTFIVGEHYYKLCHTNINFRDYYHFNGGGFVQYLKDSSGYLVIKNRGILLDKIHMHDTIQRNVYFPYEYSCLVPDSFSQKQFVLGNYSGISMNTLFIRNHPQSMVFDTACAQMFVDKIGIVKSFYYFSGCMKHCWTSHNLIRYHLN